MHLTGEFRVRRLSGLLPPFGITKRIDGRRGCTYLFGLRIGCFVVLGRRFVYRWWPIVDELDDLPGGGAGRYTGRGRLFGVISFCRFELQRI